MSFHPEKCTVLRVHRKRNPIIHNYTLKGHILEPEECTKYLGVHIAHNISWNTHIDKITKKGNSTLGFLRRNLRVGNEDSKTRAYMALVRPTLEYCSTIWNPHTTDQIRKLEMVQRRAARYVTNRYHNTSSVTSMLDHLQWESLESRRTKAQLTMLFKIANDLVDIPAQQHLSTATTRSRRTHKNSYMQPSTSTTYHQFSFFPRTIKTWNSLPSTIAESPDLVSFKQGLSTLTF